MSYKSKAERASDKAFSQAREVWAATLRAEGKKIVDGEEFQTLYDVEVLLYQTLRCFARKPWMLGEIKARERLLALYEETRKERDRCVAWNSFRLENTSRREPEPQPPDLVLFEAGGDAEGNRNGSHSETESGEDTVCAGNHGSPA